jgi:hypothetical protein
MMELRDVCVDHLQFPRPTPVDGPRVHARLASTSSHKSGLMLRCCHLLVYLSYRSMLCFPWAYVVMLLLPSYIKPHLHFASGYIDANCCIEVSAVDKSSALVASSCIAFDGLRCYHY